MAIQDRIDRLRERPRDERLAVAGSIAIGVVVVLLVGWVAFFLNGVASNGGAPIALPEATSSVGRSVIAPSSATLQWGATGAATTSDLGAMLPSDDASSSANNTHPMQ